MKIVHSLFCLTFCFFTLASLAAEDDKYPIFSRVSFYGPTNTWFVTRSQLNRVPGWDEKGEPPLPVAKAVSLATAWVVSKGGGTNSFVETIEFRSLERGNPKGKYRSFWFYKIRFHDAFRYGNSVTCIVLLDGSIVEPKSEPHTGREIDYLD